MEADAPIVVKFSNRGWKRSELNQEDSLPISIATTVNAGNAKDESSQQKKPSCQVCRTNFSRYSCPRCGIFYCTVDCYRKHTEDSGDEVSACTEAFYHSRVASINHLETLENAKSTQSILQKHHLGNSGQDEALSEEQLTDGDLYEALSNLEAHQLENGKGVDDVDFFASLPESVKAAFTKSLQNGNLYRNILQPWSPWWRKQLVTNAEISDIDGHHHDAADRSLEDCPANNAPTLDEQLLAVPPFSQISKRDPHPTVLYHLVDIIFAIVWTLHLHHGVTNATKLADSDAAATLVAASKVLSAVGGSIPQFDSLEGTLTECCKRSVQQSKLGRCNTDWSILVEDVALVFENRRLVGRALLESLELIHAAKEETRQNPSGDKGQQHDGVAHRTKSQLKQMRKKIEYFQSLVQDKAVMPDIDELPSQLRDWARAWSLDDEAVIKI